MNSKSLPQAITATAAALIVLSFFSIVESEDASFRSEQRHELSKLEIPAISSETFSDYGAVLGLRLHAAYPAVPQDALTGLPDWEKFRNAITAYDARWKLQDDQRRQFDDRLEQRSMWTSWALLGVACIYFVLTFLNKRYKLTRVERSEDGDLSDSWPAKLLKVELYRHGNRGKITFWRMTTQVAWRLVLTLYVTPLALLLSFSASYGESTGLFSACLIVSTALFGMTMYWITGALRSALTQGGPEAPRAGAA